MVHCSVVEGVLHLEVEVLLVWADCTEELGDVIGVQGAGLSWKATRKICEANMGHALKKYKNKITLAKKTFFTMQRRKVISYQIFFFCTVFEMASAPPPGTTWCSLRPNKPRLNWLASQDNSLSD